MKRVPKASTCLKPVEMHYCPGCGHREAHGMLARALDNLGAAGRSVGVVGAGCAARTYEYLDLDMAEAPRGRAVAVAAGIKRSLPHCLVFTYQSLDDGAGAGPGQLLAAAGRGEPITCIQIDNLAPGREPRQGLDLCRLLTQVDGAAFAARAACPAEAGPLLEEALALQSQNAGLCFVEILAPCPTRWRVSPKEAQGILREQKAAALPLGVFKRPDGEPA